jgi:hypothetical protein
VKDPPHLPCSQSDIRLAAAVTDDAGGLLHHLFTHHREAVLVAPAFRLVRSLLQLSSGVTLPGLTVSSSDLAPKGLGVGKFLWASSPAAVPLPARD